ncbi:MAG: HAMP domain-containing sensor histidine kinase [Panacibacter sp.]
MAVVMLVQVYLYYLSRFKKQLSTSAIAFAVISQLSLSANFYFNSGLQGPTFFGFFLTFQLVISITPKKQHLLWLLVHITVAAGLLILEYMRPDLVYYSYATRKDQYLDMLLTYIGILISIFWISGYLKYSYENQRCIIESQNQKLEKLNAEKNKIFSIVAHDLRSPLASIQGYLEILTLLPEEAPDKKLQARLLDLTTNTTDMLANLLQWAKNQMEGESIYIREVNLYQLVARVLAVQDTLARGKQITIHSEIGPEHMVLADREMLALVIRNLINNAIKFSPPVSSIRLNSYMNDGFVFLSIRDEGIGITPLQQVQLFSLNAISSYGTNNEKGTGLGLVLCKEFIEKMQGKIWYENGKPAGSIFTIAIPVAVEETVETEPSIST